MPPTTPGEPLSRHPAGSTAELLTVALPLMVSAGSHAVMIFFDRLFLAKLSADSFAAAMPAGLLNWTLMALPLGLVGYASTFVAQYHGAGRPDRVKHSVWQALMIAIVAGVLMIAMQPVWTLLTQSFGHSENVLREELIYGATLLWLCPLRMSCAALGGYFSGRGKTGVVMASGVVGSVVNLGLPPLLIFGYAIIPAGGIRGAALATVIATAAELAVLVAFAVGEVRPGIPTWRQTFGVDGELLRRLTLFGLPQGMQLLADLSSFMVVVVLVGRLGDAALQATNLAFQLNSLAFIPLIGLGHAVSAVVGHRIGEGRADRADRSVWQAAAIGTAWISLFCLLFLVAPNVALRPIAWFAGDNIESFRDEAVVLLRFIIVYSVFDVGAVVFGSAIRGAGDTRFSLLLTLAVNWLLMAIPLAVLAYSGRNTLMISWSLITVTIGAQGVGFLLRFLYGPWRTMSVLDESPVLPDLAGAVDEAADESPPQPVADAAV